MSMEKGPSIQQIPAQEYATKVNAEGEMSGENRYTQ